MRKVLITGLLIAVFGLGSVSAEPWEQFRRRAETMTRNVHVGINRGNHNTWSIDKWGALLATYDWLEFAYGQIYRNAPNLSAEQRRIYGNLYRRNAQQLQEMVRLNGIVFGGNVSATNRIRDRWGHWFDHLNHGGTISFN